MSTIKEYSNGEIAVIWDSTKCSHSANCIRGLPSVFNSNRRPWIQIKGAGSDAIVRQVEKCPSGALTYRQADPKEANNNKHVPFTAPNNKRDEGQAVKNSYTRTDIPQSFEEPPVKPERRRGMDAPPRRREPVDRSSRSNQNRSFNKPASRQRPDRAERQRPERNDRQRPERQPTQKFEKRPPVSKKTPVNRNVEKEFIFDSDDQRNFISADQELPPTNILEQHQNIPGRRDNRSKNGNTGIKIEVTDNGPLIIKGSIEIKHKDGKLETKKGANAFCRCGESDNKPFCDNSHNGFEFDF